MRLSEPMIPAAVDVRALMSDERAQVPYRRASETIIPGGLPRTLHRITNPDIVGP